MRSRVCRVLLALLATANVLLLTSRAAVAFTGADVPPNTWTQLSIPQPWPDLRGWNQGVYEGVGGSVLFYEGYVDALHPYTIYSNSIWSYSFSQNRFTLKTLSPWHGGNLPTDWYLVSSCVNPCQTTHPFDRHPYAGIVTDSQHGRTLLFGGVNGRSGLYNFQDTWALDLSTYRWTNMNPTAPPLPREEHAMVYAAAADAAILFGGDKCDYKLCGDVWSYKYTSNQWTRLDYTGQLIPPARRTHSMVYDETTQTVIVFGGDADVSYLNDTWVFDPARNEWQKITTSSAPSARVTAGFAYDTQHQVALLFGGIIGTYASGTPVNDTWIYSPSQRQWTRLFPANSPPPPGRASWRLTYDRVAGVFLLYTDVGVLWAFRYAPTGGDAIPPRAVSDLQVR